jgi:hypothetical protein
MIDLEVKESTSDFKELTPSVLVLGKISCIWEEKIMPPTIKIEPRTAIFSSMFYFSENWFLDSRLKKYQTVIELS